MLCSNCLLEENDRKKTTSTTENPFSFKKFLQAGQGGVASGRHPTANNSGGLATLDLASDLPDFVQDHYHHTNGGERSRHQTAASEVLVCLPDFALDSAGASASSDGVAAPSASGACENRNVQYLFPTAVGGGLPPPDIENQHLRHSGSNGVAANLPVVNRKSSDNDFDDNRDSDVDEGDVALATDSPFADRTNSTGGLPDFLSDSAFNGILNASSRLTFVEGASAGRAQTKTVNGFRSSHGADDDSEEDIDSVRVRQVGNGRFIIFIYC